MTCLPLIIATATKSVQSHQLGNQYIAERLSGTVETEGYPVSGAEIIVKNVRTGKSFRTTTNKKGNFAVTLQQFGIYEITVTVPGYRPATKTLVINPHLMRKSVDFEIAPEGESALGTIKGTVGATNNQSVVGTTIEIVDRRTGKPYKLTTDSSGFYKKDGLIPSNYKIIATTDSSHATSSVRDTQ